MNIILENKSMIASVSADGAELQSFKSRIGRELIWNADPKYWGRHAPVLFPIVGRLKNDTYSYKGNDYQLSRHGFARDMKFVVEKQTSDSVVFSLSESDETIKKYPFRFELKTTYRLVENTLNIEYTVSNNGDVTMPFSIGAHPAFATSGNFESYSVLFDRNELISNTITNDLLTYKTYKINAENGHLKLKYSLFENDAIVLKNQNIQSVELAEYKKSFAKISFNNFPTLGIWTVKQAPFICIEPWHGHADTPSASGNILEKTDNMNLNPGAVFNCGYSIESL